VILATGLGAVKCPAVSRGKPLFDDQFCGKPLFDDQFSGDAVNLKPVLGKIEIDGGNMHNGRLLSVVTFTDNHVMAHRCRGPGAVQLVKNEVSRLDASKQKAAAVLAVGAQHA
jgi:hypothetical protein